MLVVCSVECVENFLFVVVRYLVFIRYQYLSSHSLVVVDLIDVDIFYYLLLLSIIALYLVEGRSIIDR